MEQILQAYGLHKDTVTVIMMHCRNMKIKVRSPDRDTDFFDVVTEVLQGHTLAPYLHIICLDYVLRIFIDLLKENGFTLKNAKSRRYPTETTTDAGYADDIALLTNTPKPNSCCIAWSRQQETFTSTWTQSKLSICILIERGPFPL